MERLYGNLHEAQEDVFEGLAGDVGPEEFDGLSVEEAVEYLLSIHGLDGSQVRRLTGGLEYSDRELLQGYLERMREEKEEEDA
ncbi:MAG: hypothetical protein KatS3mg051_2042 [Anaerolineae bacterium]|nr:MAG: hypothetical protein KatS3mg051_2042 [Anaerolineae bacterium]